MTTLFNYNYSKGMGVIYYPQKKIIRKFISEKKSSILLKNEYKGFNWYQSRCKFVFNKSDKIISYKKHYIDFPIYKGRQNKFWNYLDINFEDTKIVLDNYVKIWPKRKIVPCHGDLAFSNIIFRKKYLSYFYRLGKFFIFI